MEKQKRCVVHKINTYSMVAVLLLIFLTVGCTLEDDIVREDLHNNKMKIEEIQFEELIVEPVFNRAYSKLFGHEPQMGLAARSELEEEFSFTIVEDAPVKMVTLEDGTVIYNFLIETSFSTDLNFQNLRLEISAGEMKAAMMKYELARTAEQTGHDSYAMEFTSVEVEPLDAGRAFVEPCGGTITVMVCTWGNEGEHIAGPDCTPSYIHPLTFNLPECPDGGGGGGNPMGGGQQGGGESGNGGSSGGGGNSGGGNSGGGGGNSGGGGNPNPPIIVAPVPCRNCVEFVDNCDELKKILDPAKANVRPAIEQLKSTLSMDGENGRRFDKTTTNGIISYNTVSLPYSPASEINFELLPNVTKVIAHTHPATAYPMFSWGDVHNLLTLNQVSTTGRAGLTAMVVVRSDDTWEDQVYAITVSNYIQFRQQLSEMWMDPRFNNTSELVRKQILNDELGDAFKNSNMNYEKAFLNFFKGCGLELFKANNDVTGWERVVESDALLPDQSIIQHIPCN